MKTRMFRSCAALLLAASLLVLSDAARIGCAGSQCPTGANSTAAGKETSSSKHHDAPGGNFPIFTDLAGAPYSVSYNSRCGLFPFLC